MYLHENQKRIMDYLLDNLEGATADELSAHLGITKTAVKEHLQKIERLGLIEFQDISGQVGRPKRRYKLSSEGHEVFPRQYSWLSNVLLELLAKDMGSAGVSQLMKKLADSIAASMADRFKGRTPGEVLTEMTKVMNELGYRSVVKQSDLRKGAVIEANNCVYHSVALKHPELCQFDTQLIKKVTKMDVKLESCIARGGEVCRFCLRKE